MIDVVKGISKRVVVVRFPDTRVFEQAIFIVREDAVLKSGVSAEHVLSEAMRVADGYMKKNTVHRRRPRLSPAVFGALGAALTGAVWLISTLFHG